MVVGFLLRRVDCNDGVSSHLETLIRGLSTAGVKVVLLTGPVHRHQVASPRYENLLSLAVDWVELDLPIGRWPLTWRAVSQLSDAVRRHRVQLLHLHGLSTLHLARMSIRMQAIPVIATAHPSGTSTRGPVGIAKRVIRLTGPLLRKIYFPDRAIAISSDLRDWFVNDIGMKPSRVATIFHGVDSKHFRPPTPSERSEVRKYFGLEDSDVVVTHLGRYEPVKRHDILINAIKLVSKSCTAIRALLVGTGDFETEIRQMIIKSQMSNHISLRGAILDARSAFWASDVLVLPSDREGFGLTVVEAMLCGVVPIRTSTAGAHDQIVEGENGFIIPLGGTLELASILKKLYENPSLRQRIGAAAADSAKRKFDSVLMAERTLNIYRLQLNELAI